MHPILTEVHLFGVSRPIGGYGLCVALGILIAGLLTARAAHRASRPRAALRRSRKAACGLGQS